MNSSTGNVSSPTGEVPSSTGEVPSSTGEVPSSTGEVPYSTGEDQYISGNISPRPSNSFNPDLPPLLALSAAGEPPAKRQRVIPPEELLAQRLGGPSPSPDSPPPLDLPPPLTRNVGTQIGAQVGAYVAHLYLSSGADGEIPLPSSSSSSSSTDEEGVLRRESAIDLKININEVVQEVQEKVPNAEVTAYGNGFQVIARKRRITTVMRSSEEWLLKHMKDGIRGWQSCCDYNIHPDGKIYPNQDMVIAFINEVFN